MIKLPVDPRCLRRFEVDAIRIAQRCLAFAQLPLGFQPDIHIATLRRASIQPEGMRERTDLIPRGRRRGRVRHKRRRRLTGNGFRFHRRECSIVRRIRHGAKSRHVARKRSEGRCSQNQLPRAGGFSLRVSLQAISHEFGANRPRTVRTRLRRRSPPVTAIATKDEP